MTTVCKKLFKKLSRKEKDSLERQGDSQISLGDTLERHTNILTWQAQTKESTLKVTVARRENISSIWQIKRLTAWTQTQLQHDCGRHFNSLQGLHIHKAGAM